ncbi:MAG: SUMF1/EgtB/PvdO family nonheme iron enzyme, partial [Thermoguttaceae bacterium]
MMFNNTRTMRITLIFTILFNLFLFSTLSLMAADRDMLERLASLSISSGKLEAIGDVTVNDENAEVVSRKDAQGVRRSCWRLAEKGKLIFTVRLPEGAEDVSAHLFADISAKKGQARLKWNDTILDTSEQPFLNPAKTGRDKVKVYLEASQRENTLIVLGVKDELDIKGVEFRYQIPYPSWENDKVRTTLLAPVPDQLLARKEGKSRIDFRWKASAPQADGWVDISYRQPGTDQWMTVPGAEGISFGSPQWSSGLGLHTWDYEGNLTNLEFRVLYHKGPNPVLVRQEEERKRAEQLHRLGKDLLDRKQKVLEDVKNSIDSALWRRYEGLNQRTVKKTLEQSRNELTKSEVDLTTVEQLQTEAANGLLRSLENLTIALAKEEGVLVTTWRDLLASYELCQAELNSFQEEWANQTVKGPQDSSLPAGVMPETFLAIKKGIGAVQYHIGNCYHGGKGAKEDSSEAMTWYRKAIEQGDENAKNRLEELERIAREREEEAEWQAELARWQGKSAGERKVLTIKGVEYAFRWCPAGTFEMGSPTSEKDRGGDETQHQVTLSKGFWMLETEVTQEMWKSVMGSNPSGFKGKNLPVETVSWDDCQNFIKQLNNSSPSGFKFSLPTEAHWEYACRAGTT